MKHLADSSFWEAYGKLPTAVQKGADKCFQLLKNEPRHPSLHLKKTGRFWSVRIGMKYRALGVQKDNNIIWFWIGNHSEYDKFIGNR